VQLQQLSYVLAVAEEESFTRAADRLRLAQPSLSRAVRLLEQELGVLIFNRGPGQGRVTLTPDGSALLPFMQRVVADVEATGAEARALSGMARGRLAVGATPSLVTSVLDAQQAPAQELAALYHERWEIETALDELKTHLRGARIVLRSKTAELVRQEFYGLLMAHFAVRALMHEAALKANVDPDRLSFLHAVRVVRRKLPAFNAIPPSAEESVP